jgi:exodeoxyribonuclease VII large subunit
MLGLPMVDASSGLMPRRVWGVAALIHAVSDSLAARFGACTVQGEISGFSRAASGHCYLSLKDAEGQPALVRCAMFRRAASALDFAPQDGQRVEVRGRLALYEPRGELQFVIESMQRAGAGALMEQFLRLKARLEAEGLFDGARKRDLPAYPQRLGVITSLGAAALHDVCTALARRAPHVAVVVYPALVQGADAAPALAAALALANARNEVDALILCRGGGSLEDLWSFNDERVVRAVAGSALPIVCGVGHETDFTLCDFAADLRAPTPTAAAELAAPATRDCLDTLRALAGLMQRRVGRVLDGQAQRLDAAGLRLSRPTERLRRQQVQLTQLQHRLAAAVRVQGPREQARLERLATRAQRALTGRQAAAQQRLETLGARLQALDPQRVLQRGYAWLADAQGQPVQSVKQLSVGQGVTTVLADGRAEATVTALQPAKPRRRARKAE